MSSRSASTRPVVLIARRLPANGTERLAQVCEVIEGGPGLTLEQLCELARGATAIVSDPGVMVGEQLLDAAGPQLRIVANFGVGYDNFDLDACGARGVIATNTPDVLTDATAELALALTLSAARRTGAAEVELRAGRWRGSDPEAWLGTELSGATFAVLGMGRIGSRYAALVKALAGDIIYASQAPKPEVERALGAERADLPDLLRRADVLSVHLPASPQTIAIIGSDELAAMRASAILINTARGSLVDSDALAHALRTGAIRAAGLDVYEHEPDVPEALLDAPNCVLWPHLGSATWRARAAMADLVATNVLAAIAGREPPSRLA